MSCPSDAPPRAPGGNTRCSPSSTTPARSDSALRSSPASPRVNPRRPVHHLFRLQGRTGPDHGRPARPALRAAHRGQHRPAVLPGRPTAEAATVEYAVEVLGVTDVVVCGHSHCGAIGALVRGDDLDAVPAVRDWLAHAADEPRRPTRRTRPAPTRSSTTSWPSCCGCVRTRAWSSGWPRANCGCAAGTTRCTPEPYANTARTPTPSRRCEHGRVQVPPPAAGLRRLTRRVPRRAPAVRGRRRRLRCPGRTRPGHRHRGRAGHRSAAGQQPAGVRPGRRADRAGLRGRRHLRAARARRDRAGHRAAPAGHGRAAARTLVPRDIPLGGRGHAG